MTARRNRLQPQQEHLRQQRQRPRSFSFRRTLLAVLVICFLEESFLTVRQIQDLHNDSTSSFYMDSIINSTSQSIATKDELIGLPKSMGSLLEQEKETQSSNIAITRVNDVVPSSGSASTHSGRQQQQKSPSNNESNAFLTPRLTRTEAKKRAKEERVELVRSLLRRMERTKDSTYGNQSKNILDPGLKGQGLESQAQGLELQSDDLDLDESLEGLDGLTKKEIKRMRRKRNSQYEIAFYRHHLLGEQRIHQLETKRTVVLFVCNPAYRSAVASSVISVRLQGGYLGDIAILLVDDGPSATDNTTNTTRSISIMEEELLKHRRGIPFHPLMRVRIFHTKDMFDSLMQRSSVQHLWSTPGGPSCVDDQHLANAARSRYLKTFIFHPMIAEHWEVALYMDACMTFHVPFVHSLFDMPEWNDGHILAQQDPWNIASQMLLDSRSKCPDENVTLLEDLSKEVGIALDKANFYSTSLFLYDTKILKPYTDRNDVNSSLLSDYTHNGQNSSNASHNHCPEEQARQIPLVDLLQLYHRYGSLYSRDAQIVSMYWSHVRRKMWHLPQIIFGTDFVPYEIFEDHPRQPARSVYIITAGNADRHICRENNPNQKNNSNYDHKPTKGLLTIPKKLRPKVKRRRDTGLEELRHLSKLYEQELQRQRSEMLL